jgi:hypothetical protein
MSKEWDIQNVLHLQELVHALLIGHCGWSSAEEKERHRKASNTLYSYKEQHILKQQLKQSIEGEKKDVTLKDIWNYCKKQKYFIIDGKYCEWRKADFNSPLWANSMLLWFESDDAFQKSITLSDWQDILIPNIRK